MGLNLGFIGKKIEDILGGAGQAIGGAVNGAVTEGEHLLGINLPQPGQQPQNSPTQAPPPGLAPVVRPDGSVGLPDFTAPQTGPAVAPPNLTPKLKVSLRTPAQQAVDNFSNSPITAPLNNPLTQGVAKVFGKTTPEQIRGAAEGVAQTAGGLIIPASVGLEELVNRDITGPTTAGLAAAGNVIQGKPADFSGEYNKATDSGTESITKSAQLADQLFGGKTNFSGTVTGAYNDPLGTSVQSAIAAGGPMLKVLGTTAATTAPILKGATDAAGKLIAMGFGVQALKTVPDQYQQYLAAKDPQEKSNILTQTVLTAVLGALGLAHGIKVSKETAQVVTAGIHALPDPVTPETVHAAGPENLSVQPNPEQPGQPVVPPTTVTPPKVTDTPASPAEVPPTPVTPAVGTPPLVDPAIAAATERPAVALKQDATNTQPTVIDPKRPLAGNTRLLSDSNFGTSKSDAVNLVVAHGEALDKGDFETAKRIENRMAEMPAKSGVAAELYHRMSTVREKAQKAAKAPVATDDLVDKGIVHLPEGDTGAPRVEQKPTFQNLANEGLKKKATLRVAAGQAVGRAKAAIKALPPDATPEDRQTATVALRLAKRQYANYAKAEKAPVVDAKVDPIANALGMTEADLERAKNGGVVPEEQARNDISSRKSITNNGLVTPSEELGPQTKAAIERSVMRTPEENTAANPVKVDVAPIAEGDYKGARNLPGRVSKPIQTYADSAIRAVKKLSSDEKSNFWKMVENPKLAVSAAAKEAVARWNIVSDAVHATSQALGGNTNYHSNYDFRNMDINDKGTQDALRTANGGVDVHPDDFEGLDRMSRYFNTRAEAEAAGIKFKNEGNPAADIAHYADTRSSGLRKAAIIKGLTEADAHNEEKARSLDLGYGRVLPLSHEGYRESRPFHTSLATTNKGAVALRTTNSGLKSTLLSLSQFHPINIGVLRTAPTLAAAGHPVAAAKVLYSTFRSAFGRDYADHVIGKAIDDGMVDKAAQIGMPYNSGNYGTEGSILKRGVGAHTLWDKQMPMVHDQVARSIVADLEKKNIPLSSPEALKAGRVGMEMLGEINKDVSNIHPMASRAMSDYLLANQFTPSKFLMAKDALTMGGTAGKYARIGVLANVAATATVIAGIGYLVKQESDNARDILLRALVDPAVPTPFKDSKGNTEKVRLPGTDTSDISKLLGIKLVRGTDGHLTVNWNINNLPSTVADFARARLGPLASDVVKVATNTNFAGHPLYDPNADIKTQVEQAGTTLAEGHLPIAAQGVAQTQIVKDHVPTGVKQVLDAQTPGTNPIAKGVMSAFGGTLATDQTVGKGKDTAQYYDEVAKAKAGLDRQSADAVDYFVGSKKNPVTGAYDVVPNVNDQRAKATQILDNPKAFDKLYQMQQNLKNDGQKIDPLWNESKDNITKYFQYLAMRPDGPDQKNWRLDNPWYQPLQAQRSDFFNSLPPGDPNKPKQPIEYPQASGDVAQQMKTFFALPDSKSRAVFINAHPELQSQFDAQTKYYNDLSTAEGYAPTKTFPVASPSVKAALAAKNYSAPGVQDFLNATSEYEVIKGGTEAQFVGKDLSQSALKGVENLAKYGLVSNPDGTLAVANSPGQKPGATKVSVSSGKGGSGSVKHHHVSKMFPKPVYVKRDGGNGIGGSAILNNKRGKGVSGPKNPYAGITGKIKIKKSNLTASAMKPKVSLKSSLT